MSIETIERVSRLSQFRMSFPGYYNPAAGRWAVLPSAPPFRSSLIMTFMADFCPAAKRSPGAHNSVYHRFSPMLKGQCCPIAVSNELLNQPEDPDGTIRAEGLVALQISLRNPCGHL